MKNSSIADRTRFYIGLPLSILYFPIMILTVGFYCLVPRSTFRQLQDKNREGEISKRVAELRPHVTTGETILDVGAGTGDFMQRIARELAIDTVGIEIIDYSDDENDILMFDGNTIPLPDNSVDLSLAAFVLHHTTEQENLIREMMRVSRGMILIYEDTYFTPWQFLFVVWNDFYSNILMGSLKAWKAGGKLSIVSMPMPLTFRRVADWERFFVSLGLEVVQTTVRHADVKPMSKVAFALRVPAAA